MNLTTKCLIAILCFVSYSCSIYKKEELQVIKCLNEEISSEISNLYVSDSLDYLKLMKELEKTLFVNQINKSNYRLFPTLNINTTKLDSILNKYHYYRNVFGLTHFVFTDCYHKVMSEKTRKKNYTLKLQFLMVDKIYAYNYNEREEIITDWINKIPNKDFDKILYRAPILISILNHLLGS